MRFVLGKYLHTYTIIGRCPRTLQLGIGLATYSLGVGGYCPYICPNVGAISSQAYADPQLGVIGMKLLKLGYSPVKVLQELQEHDEFFEFRQIGIVGKDGTSQCHTGSKNKEWAGHITGDGFVAMGNALVGEHTATAMAETYLKHETNSLDDRLIKALEAGRDSGGQRNVDKSHLTERSAALIVYKQDDFPFMDIRVDAHDKAVDELRRIHTFYAPYTEYMDIRAKSPAKLPTQDEWARQNGIDW